jgi:hypothetical protein
LFGGPANDTILAADGNVDYVDCGLGDNDMAYVGEIDEVEPAQAAACENIFEATEVSTPLARSLCRVHKTTPAASERGRAEEPEPNRPESSDPMREAGATSTGPFS